MGRCMFTKKRIAIISIFVMLVLLFTTIFFNQGTTYVYLSPKPSYTVVIDAGHGGVDVKLGQYVFSKKTTYFLDMWLFLIYKHHYRLYTSGLLQIHL